MAKNNKNIENFIGSIEPIIKHHIQRYSHGPFIRLNGYSYDDLFNESILVALEAANSWEPDGGKTLITWCGDAIEHLFQNLRKKHFLYQSHHIALDDLLYVVEPSSDIDVDVDSLFDHYFHSSDVSSYSDNPDYHTQLEYLSSPDFIQSIQDQSERTLYVKLYVQRLTMVSAANELKLSPSRVSQIFKSLLQTLKDKFSIVRDAGRGSNANIYHS
ncbi:MAG: hypothetical protein KKD44_17195 [Proteobacteria bacterium]|nr:hypothetical protein [Pseudomonadota bacterium]